MKGWHWWALVVTLVGGLIYYANVNGAHKMNVHQVQGTVTSVGVCVGSQSSSSHECAIKVSYNGREDFAAIDNVVSVGQTVYKTCWDRVQKGEPTSGWCNTDWSRRRDARYPLQ